MNILDKLDDMIFGKRVRQKKKQKCNCHAADDSAPLVGGYVFVNNDVCHIEEAEADIFMYRLEDGIRDLKRAEIVLAAMFEEISELRASLERGVEHMAVTKETMNIKKVLAAATDPDRAE